VRRGVGCVVFVKVTKAANDNLLDRTLSVWQPRSRCAEFGLCSPNIEEAWLESSPAALISSGPIENRERGATTPSADGFFACLGYFHRRGHGRLHRAPVSSPMVALLASKPSSPKPGSQSMPTSSVVAAQVPRRRSLARLPPSCRDEIKTALEERTPSRNGGARKK